MRAIAVVLAGCTLGGGPVVGYGRRGAFVGVEGSAGLPFAGVAGGYEEGLGFVRADLTYDPLGRCTVATGAVARAGVGFDFAGGVAFGASAGGAVPVDSQGAVAVILGVELGVRYLDGWALVLLPRITVRAIPSNLGFCERT